MAAVAAFCRQRSAVEVADILAGVVDLSGAALDGHVLPCLIADGTLEPTPHADRFAIVHPQY